MFQQRSFIHDPSAFRSFCVSCLGVAAVLAHAMGTYCRHTTSHEQRLDGCCFSLSNTSAQRASYTLRMVD
eukprot:231568-Hanusia_phi.AAC.4